MSKLMLAGVVGLFVASAVVGQQMTEPQIEGMMYVLDPASGTLQELEKQIAKTSSSTKLSTAQVAGAHGTRRIGAATKPEFRIKMKIGVIPGRYALYRFEAVDNERVVSFERQQGKVVWVQGERVRFRADRVGASYRIMLLEPLPPGEYGFSLDTADHVFLFGIDGPSQTAPIVPPASTLVSVPPVAPPNDDRIKTLDDLFAKGLITKDDYSRKRDEIAASSVPPSNGEQRLQKLNDLLKKGLIGKDDYDKKRREILSEM